MSTSKTPTKSAATLSGRRIVVGVCGGIAAYKAADLVSKLAQRDVEVTVCMTPEATRFVTPLTFEALSARPVRTEAFDLQDSADPQHISLTERADLLVIVPATANMIAKVAAGLCDDLVSLLVVAAACPVLFAPAMNNRMWAGAINQENVKKLRAVGHGFIGPADGWLACRNVGPGRLAEPADILAEIERRLARA